MIILQRLLKGILALSVGAFGLLVALDNILDYDTNWQFVRHVLSMDSMESWFTGENLRSRAVTSLFWQHAGYTAIIAGELATGVLCSLGGMVLLCSLFLPGRSAVSTGKTLFIAGCIPAVLVWYTGFAVMGGEYLSMWANQWNGQAKAYTFISFILLCLLYITRQEQE